MKKQPPEISTYAAMGMAALLPGMQRMLEIMQGAVDQLRADLARAQGNSAGVPPAVEKKRGRPKAVAPVRASGWPSDPEERSREMRRRMAKRKKKPGAAKKMHPRDPRHPEHAAWLEKMRAGVHRFRRHLGPEGRAEMARRAVESRRANQGMPSVRLEQAS